MTNKKIDFSSLYMKSTYDAACLKTENDSLKERISELENRIDELEIALKSIFESRTYAQSKGVHIIPEKVMFEAIEALDLDR
jgi:hypothetical protein